MENKIWIPRKTEVLTVSGWVQISYLYNTGGEVMGIDLDKRKVVRQKVKDLRKKSFTGKIPTLRTEVSLIQFQEASLIQKSSVFDGLEDVPPASMKFKQLSYNGELFSFSLPCGVAILRNPFKQLPIIIPESDGIFNQDDYEEGESLGFSDLTDEVDGKWFISDKMKQDDEEVPTRVTPGILPDYWLSYTSWK